MMITDKIDRRTRLPIIEFNLSLLVRQATILSDPIGSMNHNNFVEFLGIWSRCRYRETTRFQNRRPRARRVHAPRRAAAASLSQGSHQDDGGRQEEAESEISSEHGPQLLPVPEVMPHRVIIVESLK